MFASCGFNPYGNSSCALPTTASSVLQGSLARKTKGAPKTVSLSTFGSQPQRFAEAFHQFGRVVLPDIDGGVTIRDIHAAFEGRMGSATELRATKRGKPWASFSLTVNTNEEDDTATTWVRVAYFGTDAEALQESSSRGPRRTSRAG